MFNYVRFYRLFAFFSSILAVKYSLWLWRTSTSKIFAQPRAICTGEPNLHHWRFATRKHLLSSYMLFFIRFTALIHSCMLQKYLIYVELYIIKKLEAKKTKEVAKKNGEKFCLETKENNSMKNSFHSEDYASARTGKKQLNNKFRCLLSNPWSPVLLLSRWWFVIKPIKKIVGWIENFGEVFLVYTWM